MNQDSILIDRLTNRITQLESELAEERERTEFMRQEVIDLKRQLEAKGKSEFCEAAELVLSNIAEAKTLEEAKSIAQGWFEQPEPEGGDRIHT